MSKRLARLARMNGTIRDLDVTDFESAAQHYDHVREMVEERGGSYGIATGFKTIDTHYHTGMAPGHFINIIGWPEKGKSFFSTKLAANAWAQGNKVMVVSLEMSPEMVRDRIYSVMSMGQFRLSQFTKGAVNLDDFRVWSRRELESKQGLVVVSNDGRNAMTPAAVQGKIDQHQPDLVILDYHQLFMDNNRSQNPTERAKAASTEFKLLAVSNNIPIIDIVSATSTDVSDRDSPPVMAQVAWSRQLEYDADLAIAVHKQEDGMVQIVSRKNRHGDPFAFFLEVDFDRGIFNESFGD
jgi:replicative DNA helicase